MWEMMFRVALQLISTVPMITGDLVAPETLWMISMARTYVTQYHLHLQICLNYTKQHVYLQLHLLISIIAWKMGTIL